MNTLLFDPTDVLFFRDGRPMSGSLPGHGAAWPLPTVTNAALHAALHRAQSAGKIGEHCIHGHDHRSREGAGGKDSRWFGSLVTVGPFPVLATLEWLFPRPLDADLGRELTSVGATFLPLDSGARPGTSSLPSPLAYPVANTRPASKYKPANWWNRFAWEAYLGHQPGGPLALHDECDFSYSESSFGIGTCRDTDSQDGERFYSAHYLRMKPGCRIGLLAEANDKIDGDSSNKRDLIQHVFPNSGTRTPVIVGGQQRACTVERHCGDRLPLPTGLSRGFQQHNGRHLVKWILLTPAVFPQINDHQGGWLPSWVRQSDGQVMLKSGDTSRAGGEGRNAWRKRVSGMPEISARLVSAMVGKPAVVTGYALPNDAIGTTGGAKPTHLAVPAGSVYHFECDSPEAAAALAAALNWHGNGDTSAIRNRRSTHFGEKGFGIGVCGSWSFHDGTLPV